MGMKRTDIEEHRLNGIPVTVRRGPHAGTRMLIVGDAWETDPENMGACRPSPDRFRLGLARYRPLFNDWKPFSAIVAHVVDLADWHERNDAHRAAEAMRDASRQDAATALRQALKRRRLNGRVSVEDARVILRMGAADAAELARDIEGRRALMHRF